MGGNPTDGFGGGGGLRGGNHGAGGGGGYSGGNGGADEQFSCGGGVDLLTMGQISEINVVLKAMNMVE